MMNIKELTPGVYKIREIDPSYPGDSKVQMRFGYVPRKRR